ncbi:arsenate reductase/protein-tyrosine-phosphatase family protein [Rhodobacter capsulatus]|uniref:arsenate reductase/protein-tyrosine-phosphatase family protein n=1 Tax=Rhodobacter capsulatus TaxID=1061 RepID=UPI0003D357C2|nr:protein-tyrosine-phosphatase [Rhodobacter capsulatus]ETD76436.1 protein-tyrosine phosphatase [Rhodobacter capsulatus B6]ETD81979.1 protein-tyrosine phosphatase [Rhodobacter capsulatus YW1]
MIRSVLVVCVGNICRSPLGAAVLARARPGLRLSSAGLAAVVGHGADADAATVAAEVGLDLSGHLARQLSAEIGATQDLILVMEPGHRAEIFRRFPALSGRVMLFDHWTGGQGIADPFRRDLDVHRATRDRILAAAEPWIARL